jgi:prevent-host-death family protein
MYRPYSEGVSDEIPVTEARAQFSALVNRVGFGKERIILSRHGRPLVALIPAEDLAHLDGDPSAPAAVPSGPRSSQVSERRPSYLDVAARASSFPPGPVHGQ